MAQQIYLNLLSIIIVSYFICAIDHSPDEGICNTETCIEVNINALNYVHCVVLCDEYMYLGTLLANTLQIMFSMTIMKT